MSKHLVDRRDILKAAAAATAGALIAKPSDVRAAEANSRIELGIIGCGGRGSWIADLFEQHGGYKVVAVHDYFRDRVDKVGEKLQIDASRRHVGLDGYKEMLKGKLDAVAIISPPYFHPEQTLAAIAAGKHVYLAKPIAVDAPGALAIAEAAEKAKDKLSVWVDFQTRVDQYFQGAAKHIEEGLIGPAMSGQANYFSGRLGIHAKPGTPTARLRNWVFDIALSGDIIVEQNIHALDVANWFLRGHPVKAFGAGGRKVRTDVGDCWDHFVATFWYPGDVLLDFSSKQAGYGYDDIGVRIYGATGTAEAHYGGDVRIRAKTGGYRGGSSPGIYKEGAVANIKLFAESISSGKFITNARESANSTLTAILGRTAAYEGRVVTWDEMIKDGKKLDARLDLPANGPDAKD